MPSVLWLAAGTDQPGHDSTWVRIQAIPAHQKLLSLGWRSELRYPGPDDDLIVSDADVEEATRNFDIVVSAKLRGPLGAAYAKAAKRGGAHVIHVANQLPATLYREPFAYADTLVCSSGNAAFRKAGAAYDPRFVDEIVVIPDPLDDWLPAPGLCTDAPGGRLLLWIGRERHLRSVLPFRRGLPAGWRLLTLSNGPDCDIAWDAQEAQALLATCQVLLVTTDLEDGRGGVNSAPLRLLNGLAAGKPTLATPVPSYLELATPGEGRGWQVTCSPGELYEQLRRLSSPTARTLESAAARHLMTRLAPPDPAGAWLALLSEIAEQRSR